MKNIKKTQKGFEAFAISKSENVKALFTVAGGCDPETDPECQPPLG